MGWGERVHEEYSGDAGALGQREKSAEGGAERGRVVVAEERVRIRG